MFPEFIDARYGKPQAVNTAEAVRMSDSKSVDFRSGSGGCPQSCPTGAESEGSAGWRLWSVAEQLTAVRHRFDCSSGASWRGWRSANDELVCLLPFLAVSGSEFIEVCGTVGSRSKMCEDLSGADLWVSRIQFFAAGPLVKAFFDYFASY